MLIDPRNQREVVEIKPRLQWREAIKQGAILNSYWRRCNRIVTGRSASGAGHLHRTRLESIILFRINLYPLVATLAESNESLIYLNG